MLQKTIWQSGKSGYKSGEGTQVKVLALMRWEWPAGEWKSTGRSGSRDENQEWIMTGTYQTMALGANENKKGVVFIHNAWRLYIIAYIDIKMESDDFESNIKVVQDKFVSIGAWHPMGVACDKDDHSF